MSDPGEVRYLIVTSADQAEAPAFVFDPHAAPYLMIMTASGSMMVFDRTGFIEMMGAWIAAERTLEDNR